MMIVLQGNAEFWQLMGPLCSGTNNLTKLFVKSGAESARSVDQFRLFVQQVKLGGDLHKKVLNVPNCKKNKSMHLVDC